MYPYLFWGLVASIAFGFFMLYMKNWERPRQDKHKGKKELAIAFCTVFAIPYMIFLIVVALYCDLSDMRRERLRTRNK